MFATSPKSRESSPSTRLRRKEKGFALVLCLALMSLVMLLVLSLFSYVMVELWESDARRDYVLSKAHARFGLQVALGELQEHAGPDQRLTATAEILDEDPYTEEPQGLVQPYWTGVWKRDPAVPHEPEGEESPEPWNELASSEWNPHPEKEVAWLVSGNEGRGIGDEGYQHPADSYLPDPDYDPSTVWLVDRSVLRPEERVKVLKTEVRFLADRLESASAGEISGFYAFWVGDEGVKAKVNFPLGAELTDPRGDFLLNQTRFEVSPRPNLGLAQFPESSLDLAGLDESKLEKVLDRGQIHLASDSGSEGRDEYFHHLSTDSLGVLTDALMGGLKRDLTAGLGDPDQFTSYFKGESIFKDEMLFTKDFDPTDWSKGWALRWNPGRIYEKRWIRGPLWDYVRDYCQLFNEIKFSPSSPLHSSIAPRSTELDEYPDRRGEYWTEASYDRADPRSHPVAPVLLEAKVGHTLEMVPTGRKDSRGVMLYRPRVAIFPSLALWNPYNVELEAAEYELVWRPDPKFWVYATNDREIWARKIMRFERKKNIPPARRLWDKNGDGRLNERRYAQLDPDPPWWNLERKVWLSERDVMHELFLGSQKGRNITYNMKPGQGGGGVSILSQGVGLRSAPRIMHRRGFYLYRHAPGQRPPNNVSGWVRNNGHWHPIQSRYRKPLRLKTSPVRLAPGEKLYFTLSETREFRPQDDHVFNLSNQLQFKHRLYYSVPTNSRTALLCQPIPGDQPVTFVYTGGGIAHYGLSEYQRDEERDEALQNPKVLGTTLYMIRSGTKFPIKKINRGVSGMVSSQRGSYQDFGRADMLDPDPSRVIGPKLNHRLSTFHNNPQLVLAERNPRSLVDSDHLGQGQQWWYNQDTSLEGRNLARGIDPHNDESLSGDFYNGSQGRTYYGYLGHSFDVSGFQRVSSGNRNENQFLPYSSRAVLFDLPRQPLLSLGSLQHLNLSFFGNSPSFAIGNSYATSLVSRSRKWTRYNQIRTIPLGGSGTGRRSGNEHQNTIVDLSYYANERLWDGFYFSSVPTENLDYRKYPPFERFDQYYVDNRRPLPNARMTYYTGLDGRMPDAGSSGGLRDFRKASSHLLVDGGFNVNSTSVPAWKAQLGSLARGRLHVANLQDDNELVGGGKASETIELESGDLIPFPGMSVAMGQPVDPESGNSAQDHWTGFAALSKDQLQLLAEEMVQEVKIRGPFLSMGDFVNRRLTSPPDNQILRKLSKEYWPRETEESRQGLRGAIQTAIHDAGINDGGFRAKYGYEEAGLDFIPKNIGQFNPFGFAAAGLADDRSDPAGSEVPFLRKSNWGIGYDRSIRFDRRKQTQNQHPQLEFSHGEAPENKLAPTHAATGAMMPGWLSQADVLTSLAPVSNVRSDTFVVRTYGEVSSRGQKARAWCEATLQRVPEYLLDEHRNPSRGDPSHARPGEPFEDLNGNGRHDSDEPFTDYDSSGERSFLSDHGGEPIKNELNERFGRRFRIIRFRWLNPDEV